MSTPFDHMNSEPDVESGLLDSMWVVWVRRGSILAILAIVMGAMLLEFSNQPKIYESYTEILVRPMARRPGGVDIYEVVTNMEPVRRVASSRKVKELVDQRLGGLSRSAKVSVQVPFQSNSLDFIVRATSPVAAQLTADTYADVFLAYRLEELNQDLSDALGPIDRQLEEANRQIADLQDRVAMTAETERGALQARLNALAGQRQLLEQQRNDLTAPVDRQVGQVLVPAALPEDKVAPSLTKALLVGLFFGSALGVGQALVRSRLAPRVQGRSDLAEGSGVPVLGLVPKHPRGKKALVTLQAPGSEACQAYRMLGTRVLSEVQQRPLRSLIVTSPNAGEGKTAIAANLGVSLTQAGRLVVIVSAETARPMLESYLPVLDGAGLTGDGEGCLVNAPTSTPGGLRVLHGRPTELRALDPLAPDAMRQLLEELEREADLVIVDAPPVLASSEILALASLADGILLVASADRTSCASLREACNRLEQAGGRLIGAVLNNVGAVRLRFEHLFSRPNAYPSPPPGDRLTPSGATGLSSDALTSGSAYRSPSDERSSELLRP